MKLVELYGRVRYAVRIEGISRREAARRFGIDPRTAALLLTSVCRTPASSGRRRRTERMPGNPAMVSSRACATSTQGGVGLPRAIQQDVEIGGDGPGAGLHLLGVVFLQPGGRHRNQVLAFARPQGCVARYRARCVW